MGKKVMVVDDDESFLAELKETLALSGYSMTSVLAPKEAVGVAQECKPDVVVMDLKMPGMNGFQLAEEFRHTPELAHVPIIAMTGYFKDGYEPLMNMCGIKVCLRKPFSPLDVIARIEEVLPAE